MTDRPPSSKKSRFLLRAVGVGTSVAIFGTPACGGSTTAGGTQAEAGPVGFMGTAPCTVCNEDSGPLGSYVDASVQGTTIADAGPIGIPSLDASMVGQGTMIADGGGVGDSVDAAGLAPNDAGHDVVLGTVVNPGSDGGSDGGGG